MTEPTTMLQKTVLALAQVPENHVVTGWTFSRADWHQIIMDRDALRGGLAYTDDPAHPTLHGLPVTVNSEARGGYVIHMDPPCCTGTGELSAWGHSADCYTVRDL